MQQLSEGRTRTYNNENQNLGALPIRLPQIAYYIIYKKFFKRLKKFDQLYLVVQLGTIFFTHKQVTTQASKVENRSHIFSALVMPLSIGHTKNFLF